MKNETSFNKKKGVIQLPFFDFLIKD